MAFFCRANLSLLKSRPLAQPRLLLAQPARRCLSSSAYEGTFKERAAGKAQLKEFYKFTHPDFFATAPAEIKQTNEESI